MVETDATGRPFPGFGNIKEDVIAAVDETYDLGSIDKKWAALWVAIAMVTSITIGLTIGLSNVDGWLYINASTWINESLNVSGNITASNITADYFFGDGSGLTGVTVTETDPLWTANFTLYNATWSSMINTSYYLATNPFSFYNSTDFDIADYYLESNPFGFYNSTDFNIADYLLDTTDTFTGNLTFADANNCIIFHSGGKICSGV